MEPLGINDVNHYKEMAGSDWDEVKRVMEQPSHIPLTGPTKIRAAQHSEDTREARSRVNRDFSK